ncbi:MAG: CinA family protein [Anaerolineales bacterium]
MKPIVLEFEIAPLLRSLNWTLSLAESCTGGLISHRVTNIPGSSDYYIGGVNSYTNAVKHKLLGVQNETLTKYGAVSEQTVREMATGARALFQSDVSIAVSGIAGPSGGSPQKPVGTVWIGLAVHDSLDAQVFHFIGDRLAIKNQSAEMALWLLFQALIDHTQYQQQTNKIPTYQPLAVHFSFDPTGSPRIHSINLRQSEINIVSSGRQWQDESGWHILVMDIQSQVYELLYQKDGRWYCRPPQTIRSVS